MEAFTDWCNHNSWAITLISIVLSGLISWCISFLYFKKSNIFSAIVSIVEPIHQIISQPATKENCIYFEGLTKQYSMKFLSTNERSCIKCLCGAYVEASKYIPTSTIANAIIDLYHRVLSNKGINIQIEPLKDNEDNIVAHDVPTSANVELYGFLESLLKKEWVDYEIDNEIEDKVNAVLLRNAKTVFSIPNDIDFFETTSFNQVVKEYENQRWKKTFENYHKAKNDFYEMFSEVGGTA